MNLLLNRLQSEGVMQKLCIPLANQDQVGRTIAALPDRAIFFMGDHVKPGPYWAVHAEDVASLEAAGYKLMHRPDAPSDQSASADAPGDDVGESSV